jgi:hypothetical protein
MGFYLFDNPRKTELLPNETLIRGEAIESPNRKFMAYLTTTGFFTLYRFEGSNPVQMWRHACFTQSPFGEVWVGIRNGFLMGGDHRYPHRPETAWWAAPRNGLGTPPKNAKLVVQDDGNMVLYSRDANGNITGAAWSTQTNNVYPASTDPTVPVAMISAGAIAINANTVVENTLALPINVFDGSTAVLISPGASVGVNAYAGPGTIAIQTTQFAYDVDDSSSAARDVNVQTRTNGRLVQLVPGPRPPFESHLLDDSNFSHIQFPWQIEQRKKQYEDELKESESEKFG